MPLHNLSQNQTKTGVCQVTWIRPPVNKNLEAPEGAAKKRALTNLIKQED